MLGGKANGEKVKYLVCGEGPSRGVGVDQSIDGDGEYIEANQHKSIDRSISIQSTTPTRRVCWRLLPPARPSLPYIDQGFLSLCSAFFVVCRLLLLLLALAVLLSLSCATHTRWTPATTRQNCCLLLPNAPRSRRSGLDPGRSEGAFGRNSALGVGIARDGRFLPLDGCGGQASNGPNQQAPMMLLLRMLDGRIRRTPFGPSESDAGQGQSRPMQRTDPTNARRPHHTTGRTEGLPAWVGLEGPRAHPFGSRRRGEHQR